MSLFTYWPYDEVSLEATENRDSIVVKTPWIEAKVRGPIEPQAEFEMLYQKFQKKELGADDIGLVNWFFGNFDKYPLCYILPVPNEKARDTHTLIDSNLIGASLKEIISASLLNKQISISETIGNLPRENFEWDIDAALAFSKQGTLIHPESVFTVGRRYHLLELLENDKGKEVFEFVENLSKDRFADFASLIVKQNLYVTEECQRSLLPALDIAQSAKPTIEHFISQERGHDRLLGAAMKSLSLQPEKVRVSSQTIALMSLLKLAAERNLLGFAIAVDFFERSSYEKMDPLARLLLKGGFEEAAKQINRHMEINDLGGHENMGLHFLAHMVPCDPNYVREAFKIAEAVSVVMNSVTRSSVKLAK